MDQTNTQKGFSLTATIFIGLILLGAACVALYNARQSPSKIDHPIDLTPLPSEDNDRVTSFPSPIVEGGDVNTQIWRDIISNEVPCGLKTASGSAVQEGCSINKIVGNFAKGTMPMAYWIAMKSENTWKVIVTGNGIPACDKIDTYSIPKEIYGNCIEKSGDLRF